MKREKWLLINTTNKNFVIGDLPRLPGFTRKSTVDALEYHSKNDIEQSIALKSMINNGWIKITKIRDNTSESFTSDNALLAIESIEKNEASSGPAEPEDSSVTPVKLADTVIKRTNSNPTVNDDISLGYEVGSRWINTSTVPPTIFECLDNTDGSAVWRQVIIANADGEIEGPILARESTGNDVPLDLEVVVRDNKLAIGDGSTIGGVKVATEAEVLGKLDLSFMCPPDGAVMVSRKSSGTFSISCTTSSGQYAVQWWDGTVTLHNSNTSATKAVPGSGAWSGSTLKTVIVYPATAGQSVIRYSATEMGLISFTVLDPSVQELTFTGNMIRSIDVSKLINLINLHVANNELESIDVSKNTQLLYLSLQGNNLTSLNLNGLTSLYVFTCNDNNLTSLRATGVSSIYGNMHPSYTSIILSAGIRINDNNLSASALNQFYSDLANGTGLIEVQNNPGTTGDDPTIATAKGYTVFGT